jgi:hypothetical protein
MVTKDKSPPEPFEMGVGRDPGIFDNKYFISFFATDRESGIDYYEVKEGDQTFVRAESPYLLKDQSLRSTIKVKAVDKAGNERLTELPASYPPLPFYKTALFWIIIFMLIFGIYTFWRISSPRSRI